MLSYFPFNIWYVSFLFEVTIIHWHRTYLIVCQKTPRNLKPWLAKTMNWNNFWWYIIIFVDFLSAMSFRTSKDLNFLPSFSFFFETKSWHKHQFLSDSNKLGNFNNTNKEFLPKKSSPQKILPKNSSEKNSKKNPKNTPLNSRKNPKNFQSIFPKSS